MIKETEKAYIAGLVDGEGCITIAKRKNGQYKKGKGKPWYYQATVVVSNTDKRIVDFVTSRYGGWITKPKLQENRKQVYNWFVSAEERKRFLQDILQYLVIKKRQAEIILSFPNYVDRGWGGKVSVGRSQEEFEKQRDFWFEIKKLNSRGVKRFLKESKTSRRPFPRN